MYHGISSQTSYSPDPEQLIVKHTRINSSSWLSQSVLDTLSVSSLTSSSSSSVLYMWWSLMRSEPLKRVQLNSVTSSTLWCCQNIVYKLFLFSSSWSSLTGCVWSWVCLYWFITATGEICWTYMSYFNIYYYYSDIIYIYQIFLIQIFL